MPMTAKAAQLYSVHKRKADRLWKLYEGEMNNLFAKGMPPTHFFRVGNLAANHTIAAHAIHNCPASWETSETDRKLAEIKAYLGQPLYDEWLEAGAAKNFESYVADEFEKLFPTTINVTRPKETLGDGIVYLDPEMNIDPRTFRERLHDEAGADLQRMNSELRGGL